MFFSKSAVGYILKGVTQSNQIAECENRR